MDAELRTDTEHQNFVSIYRGFAYVGEELESYTKEGLDLTYQKIYKTLAGYPPCDKECSRIYKCQYVKWCNTCSGWRKLLLKTRKSQNVPWELTHSWEWPHAYANIIEVYLPALWQSDGIDIKDISTACFIWENCTQFGIKPYIIKNIRKFRNQYFAHNTSLKATDLEKSKVFDVLRDLLKENGVQKYINYQECIKHLSDIEKGYQIDKWMIEVQDLIDQHGLTLNKLDKTSENIQMQQNILHRDIKEGQDYLIKGQDDLRRDVENIQKDVLVFSRDLNKLFQRKESVISKLFKCKTRCVLTCIPIMLIVITLIYVFYFIPFDPETVKEHHDGACIAEEYKIPFPQDLPLLGYLNEHEKVIGRQWLMESLKDNLFRSNSSKKNHGLVLVADMGYGKSAFLSKLLCPGSMHIAKKIHKHIVAFYVCKFDVRSTHFPERFIRRLVGFLALKSAEYDNRVSMFHENHILFNRESCNKEAEACFDQGVTIPLKQLSSVADTPWIIAIDAIDECESSGSNPILNLLSERIMQLPKWLKFVITSRNIPSLTLLRKKMKFQYLYSNDTRNIEDIKLYIKNSFPKNIHGEVINGLVYKSEGNFVYIMQALKWILDNKENETVADFPSDLGDIYEINFRRQFGDASYKAPKSILEIICSTLNPVSKSDIFTILQSSNSSLKVNDFDQYFNSLSFFLKIDIVVRISHHALYFWLTDKQNENYRISPKNGHALISKYLFSKVTGKHTKDIVDLAIHVANSADSSLRKMFLSIAVMESNSLHKNSALHQLIWRTPNVDALGLLIHHFPDVNALNKGNVTPSFVAAAKGHTDQLKLLHLKGADMSFTVKGKMMMNSYDVLNKLEMIKLHYYSGYSLLHISSQHGHIATVKYILAKNYSLIHVRNTLGLNAGHVACENGHLKVVKLMKIIHTKAFFYECMYYAAKENNVHIAKWLISNGFIFECISDELSFEAVKNITNLDLDNLIEEGFAIFPNDSLSLDLIVPLDIWWIIFKDNPLMTAIKTGSLDVAKYLLEKFYEASSCNDALGYTAALASVRFNRTELFPLLNNGITSDRCGKIPTHLNHAEIIETYLSERCPEGGSVSHLVALYVPGVEIYHYVIGNRLDVNWNHPDSFGNYPIHYAVSNRNFLFITLSEKGTFSLISKNNFSLINTLALNGSTAYHISIMSGQYVSMLYLTNFFKKPVPDIKDYYGRGMIHYTVLKEYDNIAASLEMESQEQSLHTFRYLLEISYHSLTTRDHLGRNILHYSLKNGHYHIVIYLFHRQKTKFYSMLSVKDDNGNTPFDFAMKEKERYNQVIILPEICTFYEIYFKFANIKEENFPNIMSSWELTMQYLIRRFSSQEYYYYIEPNLKYIMEKSPYLLTAVLVYHKNVNVKLLQRLLVESKVNPLTSFMHLVIARHKPLAFISCKQPLSLSPLHYVLLTHDHKNSVFSFDYNDVQAFLYMIFKPNNKTFALKCPDKNGFNIFHYSLIGGNIQSARILLLENKTVTNENVTLKDVFLMAMLSRLKTDQQNYKKCNEHPQTTCYKLNLNQTQDKCTDTFLLELFHINKISLSFNFFCNDESRELSLVHLFAINGMARTLEAVAQMFGNEILSCQSKDGFTPLYFGKLFSQDNVLAIVGYHHDLKFPNVEAEEWIIWSMLNKFPQFHLNENVHSLTVSSFSSRRLIKESMMVSDDFKNSLAIGDGDFSHNSDKILGYLLSLELTKILSKIYQLELLFLTMDRRLVVQK